LEHAGCRVTPFVTSENISHSGDAISTRFGLY
jgi:hypothetical protein